MRKSIILSMIVLFVIGTCSMAFGQCKNPDGKGYFQIGVGPSWDYNNPLHENGLLLPVNIVLPIDNHISMSLSGLYYQSQATYLHGPYGSYTYIKDNHMYTNFTVGLRIHF